MTFPSDDAATVKHVPSPSTRRRAPPVLWGRAPAGGQAVNQYLCASRASVLAAPIMFAQIFCCSSIKLSNIAAKIWTGANIIARPGSRPDAVFDVAGLTQFVTCRE